MTGARPDLDGPAALPEPSRWLLASVGIGCLLLVAGLLVWAVLA